MIPVRLQVRNFLCYRDNVPPLDFAGIHVACLSGANGHGKSALLDAMTWALWGKARARQDDQLIHSGETEMEVDFDFQLDSQLYRVIRKRSSKGRGQSALELQIQDDGRFRSLSEDSMRATQARINGILRMDYDTFINSAFLLQGRADEFTVKSPADRKQVLADILGLRVYDRAEEIAKERAREAEQAIADLTSQIKEIDRELANLPAYQAEEKKYAIDAERLAGEREKADAEFAAAQERLNQLRLQQQQLDELRRRHAQDEKTLQGRESQRNAVVVRIAELEALLADAESIESGYGQLLQARAAEAVLGKKALQAQELAAQGMKLENAIAQARQKMALELEQAQKRAAEKEAEASQAELLRVQLKQAQESLAGLDEKERERDARRQSAQEVSLEAERLKAENAQLHREMADLRARVDELSEAGAECPLCRSPLSEDNRQRLIAEMTAEGHDKRRAFDANKERILALEVQHKALQKETTSLEAALRARPKAQHDEAALGHKLAQAEAAAEELAALREATAALQKRLDGRDYAAGEQKHLADVQDQQRALGYDPQEHARLRGEVERLSSFEARRMSLAGAREQLQTARGDLARLEEEIAGLQAALAESSRRKQELEGSLAGLPKAEGDWRTAKARLDALSLDERSARDRLAATRQKLEFCDRQAAQKEEKKSALDGAKSEKGVYDDLRLAFGKKGIQAMIIESVIPEIQDEANRLLERMTDGKMTVTMQTQRETKAGSTVETLDIHIADELGTRPYELFSGGEAFRVNFAIRIALSKLLARRAGAQLRTLIMDEGFGSQDATGRQKLVEAIQSVQGDFEKILVITHVEELQDAFPVRIHVEKTAEGSTFSIV